MKKTNDFTEGIILPKLLGFAFPVLLSLFLQAMYGAVDLLVVGQFSSAAAVSAVSTGSQIMQSVTTVITGIAMGITGLVGQNIGAGKVPRAEKALFCGIATSVLAGLCLGYLSFFHGDWMASLVQIILCLGYFSMFHKKMRSRTE